MTKRSFDLVPVPTLEAYPEHILSAVFLAQHHRASFVCQAHTRELNRRLRLPTDEEAARRLGRRVHAPNPDPDLVARPPISLGVLGRAATLVSGQAPRETAPRAAVWRGLMSARCRPRGVRRRIAVQLRRSWR